MTVDLSSMRHNSLLGKPVPEQSVREFLRGSLLTVYRRLTFFSLVLENAVLEGKLNSELTIGEFVSMYDWHRIVKLLNNDTMSELSRMGFIKFYDRCMLSDTAHDWDDNSTVTIERQLRGLAREITKLNFHDSLLMMKACHNISESARQRPSVLEYDRSKVTPLCILTDAIRGGELSMGDYVTLTLKWTKTFSPEKPLFINDCSIEDMVRGVRMKQDNFFSGILDDRDVYSIAKRLNDIKNMQTIIDFFNDYMYETYSKPFNDKSSPSLERHSIYLKNDERVRIPKPVQDAFVRGCNDGIPATWALEVNGDVFIDSIKSTVREGHFPGF